MDRPGWRSSGAVQAKNQRPAAGRAADAVSADGRHVPRPARPCWRAGRRHSAPSKAPRSAGSCQVIWAKGLVLFKLWPKPIGRVGKQHPGDHSLVEVDGNRREHHGGGVCRVPEVPYQSVSHGARRAAARTHAGPSRCVLKNPGLPLQLPCSGLQYLRVMFGPGVRSKWRRRSGAH
jgi:hypothetical protein